MLLKLLAFALCLPLQAQIVVKLTPDTASQTAVIGRTHHLQYWVLTIANTGPDSRTLALEQIILASPVNLVPLGDARNIITAKIARSTWGEVLHVSGYVIMGSSLALAILSRSSPSIGTNTLLNVSLAGSVATAADQIASANLPNGSTLMNQLSYPITLGPAGSSNAYAVDHEFSIGWWKDAAAQVVTIP